MKPETIVGFFIKMLPAMLNVDLKNEIEDCSIVGFFIKLLPAMLDVDLQIKLRIVL